MSSLIMVLAGTVIGFFVGWLTLGLCMASKHSEQDEEDEDEES